MDWPFDTSLDLDYPLYTRGNIGEVFPDVVAPLTISLGANLFEEAWRLAYFATSTLERPTAPWTCCVYVGGRAYLNLSLLRKFADLAPGTSPDEFDKQFLEVGAQLPPYERAPIAGFDRHSSEIEWWATNSLFFPSDEEIALDSMRVRQQREAGRASRAISEPVALLGRMHGLQFPLMMLLRRHLDISAMASVSLGTLSRGLREHFGDEGTDLAHKLVGGLGEVASAEATVALADLATVPPQGFDEALDAFLAEYGFRGANEWDYASPSWELRPDVVKRLIEASRGADRHEAGVVVERHEAKERIEADGLAEKWPEYPIWLGAAEFFVANRERTKANAITVVNEVRLDAVELGQRLVASGDLETVDDIFLCSAAELDGAVCDGIPLDGDELAKRAETMAWLRTLQEPLVLDARDPSTPETWPTREASRHEAATQAASANGSVLHGTAGSSGTARGRARVVRNPYDDEPPKAGEVLIAPITDPGWTPLFVPASAVVCEVGGELSHAVIVARELGIPAVVAAIGALDTIRTGDLVEVDGSSGTVRVLERAQ